MSIADEGVDYGNWSTGDDNRSERHLIYYGYLQNVSLTVSFSNVMLYYSVSTVCGPLRC